MQRSLTATAAALLLGASTLGAHAVELVTNGDFETGNLSGWTHSGNLDFTGVDFTAGGAGHGLYEAFLGPYGSTGVLSQSLVTVIGEIYTVGFDLQNEGGSINSFEATIGGATLTSFTNGSAFSYFRLTNIFQATSTSTLLSFTFRQDPNYFHLDNVSVEGVSAPVPEPESYAMMLAGLGVMGYLARRRKALPTASSKA